MGISKEDLVRTRLVIGEPILKNDASEPEENSLRQIFVSRNMPSTKISYYILTNISRTESLEILLLKDGVEHKIQLPEAMLLKIAEYFRTYEKSGAIEDADCAMFAYFVNGVPFSGPPKSEDWIMNRLDESALAIGSTVILGSRVAHDPEKINIIHWAIYLGDGLYLSKAGKEKLIALNMADMKKMYGVGMALQVSPK